MRDFFKQCDKCRKNSETTPQETLGMAYFSDDLGIAIYTHTSFTQNLCDECLHKYNRIYSKHEKQIAMEWERS